MKHREMTVTRLLTISLYGGLLCLVPMLTGCERLQQFQANPWVERVFIYAPGLAWTIGLWMVACGLVALPIALCVFFGLRRIGGFRWNWVYAKYFRAFTCVLIVIVTIIAGISIGLNEGVYRGLRDVVESEELKEELRPAGGSGADVIACLYICVARVPIEDMNAAIKEEVTNKKRVEKQIDQADDDSRAEISSTSSPQTKGPLMQALEKRIDVDLESFRKGEWTVDIRELRRKLDDAKTSILDAVLPDIKENIRNDFPSLNEGKDAQVFDWFLDTFGEMLITKVASDKLEEAGLKDPIIMIWDGLEEAAQERGNPDTISHEDLANYLPHTVLRACVVYPTKLMLRGNQSSLVLIWLLIIILLVGLFQLAEFTRSRNYHVKIMIWIKSQKTSEKGVPSP